MSETPDHNSSSGSFNFRRIATRNSTVVVRLALMSVAVGYLIWRLIEMWRANSVLLPAMGGAVIMLTGFYFFVRGNIRPTRAAVLSWAGSVCRVGTRLFPNDVGLARDPVRKRSSRPCRVWIGM